VAESLESRVRHLKSRLESLQLLYSNKDRPLAVDLEIQVIQEQIKHLVEPAATNQEILH
jgi:hypothetical protein